MKTHEWEERLSPQPKKLNDLRSKLDAAKAYMAHADRGIKEKEIAFKSDAAADDTLTNQTKRNAYVEGRKSGDGEYQKLLANRTELAAEIQELENQYQLAREIMKVDLALIRHEIAMAQEVNDE